jgi:hypothetical protein
MKSGIKTIIVGAVMFLMGAFIVPFLFLLPLFLEHHQQNQFVGPGSIHIEVKEPGRYYLWNDFRTIYNGRSFNRSEKTPDGLDIRIENAEGHALPFVSDLNISSSSNDSSKNSIGYVEIEQPGKVSVQISGGTEERIFSFSRSRLLKLFLLILAGFGVSGIIALTGFGLIIWGVVKVVRKN